MIIPTTLDGKPFEGMALVLLAMQIISLRIELRGTKSLIGSFLAFLLPCIGFFLLGTQRIAELKTYLLVFGVFGLILFLVSILNKNTTMAFRTAVGLGASIAAYLLIDTRYDTAVWVLFASNLFSLIYALFVVGPAKSAAVSLLEETKLLESRLRTADNLIKLRKANGLTTNELEKARQEMYRELVQLSRRAGMDVDKVRAENQSNQSRDRQLAIMRNAMYGPRK